MYRLDQAANRPKLEFVPKTLNDLHPVDVIADDINGNNRSRHIIIIIDFSR